jgi:Ribosomal protein L13e
MPKIAEKPIVKYFRKGISTERLGRGFSVTEVRQAGILNSRLARSKGIPIDSFRNSAYPENVEKLSKIFSDAKSSVSRPAPSKGKTLSRKSTKKVENDTKKISPKNESQSPKKRATIGKIVRRKKTEPKV